MYVSKINANKCDLWNLNGTLNETHRARRTTEDRQQPNGNKITMNSFFSAENVICGKEKKLTIQVFWRNKFCGLRKNVTTEASPPRSRTDVYHESTMRICWARFRRADGVIGVQFYTKYEYCQQLNVDRSGGPNVCVRVLSGALTVGTRNTLIDPLVTWLMNT